MNQRDMQGQQGGHGNDQRRQPQAQDDRYLPHPQGAPRGQQDDFNRHDSARQGGYQAGGHGDQQEGRMFDRGQQGDAGWAPGSFGFQQGAGSSGPGGYAGRHEAQPGGRGDFGRHDDDRNQRYRGPDSAVEWGNSGAPPWGRDDESFGSSPRSGQGRFGAAGQADPHRFDPDYDQWRSEQLRNLDDDYDAWRKDRYKKFSAEFNAWRSSRSGSQPGRDDSSSTRGQAGSGSSTSIGSTQDEPGSGKPASGGGAAEGSSPAGGASSGKK